MTALLVMWFVVGLIMILCERENRKDAALTAALLPVIIVYAALMLIHVSSGWCAARIDNLVDRIFD